MRIVVGLNEKIGLMFTKFKIEVTQDENFRDTFDS